MATLPNSKNGEEPEAVPEPESSPALRWTTVVLRIVVIAAILGATGYLSYHWLMNPPTAERRPPRKEATLVEAIPVHAETVNVIIAQNGEPVPAREINLAARVSGQIAAINPSFVPGGHFREGDTILRIDPDDYELAVDQAQANLVKAQSDLKLEMGQQSVAKLEYELLGELAMEEDESLVLRQPQLESKKAAVAVAQAALEKARLELERTNIKAPFNAIVQERHVELGAYVNPGTPLASLAGSDEYWVELTVPVDELHWLQIPGFNGDTGSEARIYHAPAWGEGVYREGRVARLLSDVEVGSRMARLLVTIDDPLELQGNVETPHPLILGTFVRVELIGQELPRVFKVPAAGVREGQYLWIMNAEKQLDIREMRAEWASQEYTYVTEGLNDGDMLIVSDLGAPVPGMPLRTDADEPDNGQAPPSGSDKPSTSESQS